MGLVGTSGSGKTTLILKLIQHFTAQGLRVATIKHAHAGFDIDHPGKDSMRHRQAGAAQVVVSSPRRIAHIEERAQDTEATLPQLLARLSPCDLVLVEGYKAHPHPKIQIYRPDNGKPPLDALQNVIATLSPDGQPSLDDTQAVAHMIMTHAVPLQDLLA